MKKLLLIISVFCSVVLNAQVTLTYQTHGLKPYYEHLTQGVENLSQGEAGENKIWDFSAIDCKILKKSEIFDVDELDSKRIVPYSNIIILDGENRFYFNCDEFGIEYHGLTTPKAVIHFYEPIVRMKYPFSYGDKISGQLEGEGIYYGQLHSSIEGDYYVEGDAYGTLVLPNNTIVTNVLRVKSINHIFETACQTTEIYNEKYLWYSQDYPLPIMAVTIDRVTTKDGTTTNTNGYYNEEAFQQSLEQTKLDDINFSVNVFPNPFTESVNISYNIEDKANVSVEIYSAIGVRVANLVNNKQQYGSQSIDFNAHDKSLAVGSYYVKFTIDDKVIMRKIIFIN